MVGGSWEGPYLEAILQVPNYPGAEYQSWYLPTLVPTLVVRNKSNGGRRCGTLWERAHARARATRAHRPPSLLEPLLGSLSLVLLQEYQRWYNLYVMLVSFTWGNIRICGGKAGLRSDLWGYALCTPSYPNISPPYPNRSELFHHTPTDLNVILLYPNRSELAPST